VKITKFNPRVKGQVSQGANGHDLCTKANRHAGFDKDQMTQGSNDFDPSEGRVNRARFKVQNPPLKGRARYDSCPSRGIDRVTILFVSECIQQIANDRYFPYTLHHSIRKTGLKTRRIGTGDRPLGRLVPCPVSAVETLVRR
jgi:hypothetical protein